MVLAHLRRALPHQQPGAGLASLSEQLTRSSTLRDAVASTPVRSYITTPASRQRIFDPPTNIPTPISRCTRPGISSRELTLRARSPLVALTLHSSPTLSVARHFYASQAVKDGKLEDAKPAVQGQVNAQSSQSAEGADEAQQQKVNAKRERARKAAKVNLRARLSSQGKEPKKSFWAMLRSPGEVRRLFRFARPEALPLAGAIVLLLSSSAITLAVPWTVGKVMDLASSTSFEDTRIFGLTLYQFFPAFALFLTLGAAANFGRIVLLRIIGERVVTRLRSQLYRKTLSQDAEFFDANRVGDLISRLSSDTVIVGKSITQNVSDGLRSFVAGCAGLVAMAWISPNLVMTILYAAPFIGTATFFYTRMIRRLGRAMQVNLGILTKIAEERLGNVKTSQAFAGERQEVRRYNSQVRKIFEIGKKTSLFDATFFSWNGWIGNMMIIALLWSGGGMVRDGLLTQGDLTSFMMYAFWAGTSIMGFSNFLGELMKGVGAATRLFELQDRDPVIHPTKGTKVESASGDIKFTDVTFAYPTRPAVPIFQGLNFDIPSGSNVCIVGPSGGGKSTVSSLLMRFYDPVTGSISIGGTEVTKMNAKSLRRHIGVVSQEPALFSGTIAENISYGREHATAAEIELAAKRANCDFIDDLPLGMDTDLGAKGSQISGGQKQRIAIARALIKDPDILILDEATSALDAESETAINNTLNELLQGRITTISIAHRLSTIKRSDKIIVLNREGSVAEMGSYNALSANKDSAFSKLMEWQMTGGEATAPPEKHQPRVFDNEVAEDDADESEEQESAEEQVPEDGEGQQANEKAAEK
ncbi:ATP-dependent permease MDL1 [Xylariomycetidae sp. FL0641]|nr:ATP-dependent permease MDL1 [Xylariomycetidae sp. FL0641]